MSLRERAANIDLLDETEVEILEGEKILRIPVSEIYSEPQVRKYFPDSEIESLGNSLVEHGQIQPIVVFPLDGRGYKIQKGECRWRAATLKGLTHLDSVVRNTGTVFQQLAENIHRIDLDPFEVGAALLMMKKEKKLNNKQLAQKMSISESDVSSFLKTVDAPEFVVNAYYSGKLGDKETVNSLRIAANLNENEAKELTKSNVTRKEAQDLAKRLKKTSKQEASKASLKDKKLISSKPVASQVESKPKAVLVSLSDGRQGVIDLFGSADDGSVIVITEASPEGEAVLASDLSLIGYVDG